MYIITLKNSFSVIILKFFSWNTLLQSLLIPANQNLNGKLVWKHEFIYTITLKTSLLVIFVECLSWDALLQGLQIVGVYGEVVGRGVLHTILGIDLCFRASLPDENLLHNNYIFQSRN
jgi:hypothetical protein